MSPKQLAQIIVDALGDHLQVDDEGGDGAVTFCDTEIIDEGRPGKLTVATQSYDGHRFFIEVEQYD